MTYTKQEFDKCFGEYLQHRHVYLRNFQGTWRNARQLNDGPEGQLAHDILKSAILGDSVYNGPQEANHPKLREWNAEAAETVNQNIQRYVRVLRYGAGNNWVSNFEYHLLLSELAGIKVTIPHQIKKKSRKKLIEIPRKDNTAQALASP